MACLFIGERFEEDVIMAENLPAFNWNDFYYRNNAKIVESLLDREVVEFGEIVDSFFPYTLNGQQKKISGQMVFDLFNHQFSAWLGDIFNALPACFICIQIPDAIEKIDFQILSTLPNRIALNPFPHVIKSQDDFYNDIQKCTKVYADPILSILISNEFLPEEIRRLARLSTTQCGFVYNENYYQELDSLSNDEVVSSFLNLSGEVPKLLSFEEVKGSIEEFKTVDDIFQAMFSNRIGAYIKINPEYVISSGIRFVRRGYPSLYRMGNCGNPLYLKRYNCLERLTQKQIKELWINGHIKLDSYHFQNSVQQTDIEAKFHIERTIKSFNDKMKIKVSDLIFLKEELKQKNPKPVKIPEGDHWTVLARVVADECFDKDTRNGCRDSLKGYARRVMELMQQRDIKSPRGIIDNHLTVMRDALQGDKWWAKKSK